MIKFKSAVGSAGSDVIFLDPDTICAAYTSRNSDHYTTIESLGSIYTVEGKAEEVAEQIVEAKIAYQVRLKAALVKPRAKPKPKSKEPHKYTTANFCAMTCDEGAFWRYLRETKQYDCNNKDDARSFVLMRCQIDTRAKLDTNSEAKAAWEKIASDYKTWMALV